MNINRFIKKNIFLIILFLVLVFGIMYLRSKEGFQNRSQPSCNFNFCTGDFEVVTDPSGVRGCFKKCNIIRKGYIASRSNPLICRESTGKKPKTFSRNTDANKQKNIQGNNGCETCPQAYTCDISGNISATPLKKVFHTDICKDINGIKSGNDCLYCPITRTERNKSNILNWRPRPQNNMCNGRQSISSYK